MHKLSNYSIISLILLQTIILSKDLTCITSFEGKFYFFNGFENKLEIYNKFEKLILSENLSNISKGNTTDFFIKYNELNSYLFSSISGMIFMLDENFHLRSSQDLYKLFDLNFNRKIYSLNYNSLLIASEELEKFFHTHSLSVAIFFGSSM